MRKAYVTYLSGSAAVDSIAVKFGDELLHLGEAADFLAAWTFWRSDEDIESEPPKFVDRLRRDYIKVVRADGFEVVAYIVYGDHKVSLNSADGSPLVVVGFRVA